MELSQLLSVWTKRVLIYVLVCSSTCSVAAGFSTVTSCWFSCFSERSCFGSLTFLVSLQYAKTPYVRMLSPTSSIVRYHRLTGSWNTITLGMFCKLKSNTTITSEPHQKKTAEIITGMNNDFSKRIRANNWRLFTLNSVRTVATNKKARSRNEFGSKPP